MCIQNRLSANGGVIEMRPPPGHLGVAAPQRGLHLSGGIGGDAGGAATHDLPERVGDQPGGQRLGPCAGIGQTDVQTMGQTNGGQHTGIQAGPNSRFCERIQQAA